MEDRIENAMISVEHLTVRFSGKIILEDVSLSVPCGELVVIVGPSGSGKSTLLKAINRLNDCFPKCRTSGSVRVRLDGINQDLYEGAIPPNELRRRIGIVFQTPAVLPLSVEKNISMPLKVTLGMNGPALTERVEWALRQVSLWDEVKERLRDEAAKLSGGQQQRLCLARTLALGPQVLLLDEPTASLDFRSAKKIEQLLLRLKNDYCVVAVSHSLSQARRLADRLYVIREGRAVQEMDKTSLSDPVLFGRLIEEAF